MRGLTLGWACGTENMGGAEGCLGVGQGGTQVKLCIPGQG